MRAGTIRGWLAVASLFAGGLAAAEVPRPEARPAILAALAEAVAPLPEAAPRPVEPVPAVAAAPVAPPAAPTIGPETNLPLPRFVSLKVSEGNVRRGPSLSHRIDWVFLRRDMPLQIVAEYGHWRRVVDREGLGGWVHYSLLSGARTVLIDTDLTPLRARPEPDSPEVARLEAGVIARLGTCLPDWCRLTAGGYRGWAQKAALWGVAEDELRD